MIIDYRALGPFLRERRTERNLTREEVSKRVGFHHLTLNAIEQGLQDPSVWHLKQLATAYGIYLEVGFGAASWGDDS
jgi:transcriptional regulator with XRE-family HTH domain